MNNKKEDLKKKEREEWIESQWKIVKSIYFRAYKGRAHYADISDIEHHMRFFDYIQKERTDMADYLRDVVEDTDWTIEQIAAEGICPKVVEAVKYLVRQSNETFMQYVERVAQNDIAALVTYSYILDGLEIKRFKSLTKYDFNYLNTLLEAYHYLDNLEQQKWDKEHYKDLIDE